MSGRQFSLAEHYLALCEEGGWMAVLLIDGTQVGDRIPVRATRTGEGLLLVSDPIPHRIIQRCELVVYATPDGSDWLLRSHQTNGVAIGERLEISVQLPWPF